MIKCYYCDEESVMNVSGTEMCSDCADRIFSAMWDDGEEELEYVEDDE